MKKKFWDAGSLVRVIWHDAYSGNYWLTQGELEDYRKSPAVVRSIGEVFQHDQNGITLINGFFSETKKFPTYFHIPKGCIEKIERISNRKYWSQP